MTEYLNNIWRLRYFWMAMVRNDLRNRYRRSIIGLGWSLLHPIAMTTVLCVVFSQIFNAEIRTYAPFLLTGLTFWHFITSVMLGGCQSFFQSESYIRQHPAPLAIYPLRTVLSAGFHFLIGLGVSILFVWSIHGFSNVPALLSLIPSLVLLLVFAWSMAVCVGMLNVMFQDAQHLIEVVLQVLFYVTPIMYPAALLAERKFGWLMNLNPLAVLLNLVRQPILEGTLPSATTMGIGLASGLVAMTTATLLLRWLEKRMIFYL